MQTCISFTSTAQKTLASKNNIEKWNDSQDYFDSKEYLKSIYAFFDYLDENILKHYTNADKSQIVIPQGSAVVIVDISPEVISIRAPFIKLPADKRLPILRKCTELNFGTMVLPQITLEEDSLVMLYSMPVELCEPYKLYDVLRDIAVNADKYDDEFVNKFGAIRLMEPQVTNYPAAALSAIIETTQKIATEAMEYATYFESKRDQVLASDALFIGINRIKYYANPVGVASNKLNDAVDAFYGRTYDIGAKIKIMRTALESIKNLAPEEANDTYNLSYQLIPTKGNASRSYLKDWIVRQYEDAASMYNKEHYSTATSYSLYTLYIILAEFNIEDSSRQAIEGTLKQAAGKSWKEASTILMKAMTFFYRNEEDNLEFEGEKEAVASEEYSNTVNNVIDQYKSLLGNFMKGFGLK